MVQALVLDFDGVILESLDVKTRAFVELFADHPEHHEAIVRLHLEEAGLSRFVKFKRIHREMLGLPLDAAASERLGERFSAIVYQEMLTCPFVAGAPAFLAEAAARCPLFVASGTPEKELRDIVERRGIGPLLAGVFGTPAGKDEIVRRLLGEHGFDAGSCVFVGDARADWEAARATGLRFVGRAAAGEEPPFPPGEALLVVSDMEELRARWPEVEAAVERFRARD